MTVAARAGRRRARPSRRRSVASFPLPCSSRWRRRPSASSTSVPISRVRGDSAAALAGELAVGALLVAAALAAQAWRPGASPPRSRRPASAGCFSNGTVPAPAAFTAGLVLYAVWPPLLAQAALRGPDERPLGRPAVALLIVAYATSLGMLGLAAAATTHSRRDASTVRPITSSSRAMPTAGTSSGSSA